LCLTKSSDAQYTKYVLHIIHRVFFATFEACMRDVLRINLCSPLTLSFGLGGFAKLVHYEPALPRDLYTSLSIYLLLTLDLKVGVELSHSSLAPISGPAFITILLWCCTPVPACIVLRRLGKFIIAVSAGIAGHYGSVSAVTFIAAQQFTTSVGAAEGFMPTLLTLLAIPVIQVARAIGVFPMSDAEGEGVRQRRVGESLGANIRMEMILPPA